MTAEFIDTLFLGLLTYLGHSTVFLTLGLLITGFALMKNHALKEMILRFALFGALITTPLHLSGAFDPFFQPIKIPEETVKSEPASLGVNEPVVHETLPSVPTVTAETRALGTGEAKPHNMNETEKTFSFSLANIVLMLWALIGAALLFQLGYLIFDLKRQLAGRIEMKKGRAVKITGTLSNIAGIPAPRLSKKEDLAGPFCLGTGEIVLPMWAEDLPRHQLKALLAHEIAHIKRSDPSWILAARIVQSIFFFQPLNIFAARRLSELSEFACDAWAGKVCGSGMPLAECLAECAKRHLGRAPSALGAAMATKRSPIVERTQMLLAGIRDYAKPASVFSKVIVLGAFIVGGTMIPVFAFDEISPAVSPPPEVEPLSAESLQGAAPVPEVEPLPPESLQGVAPLPTVEPLPAELLQSVEPPKAEEAPEAEENATVPEGTSFKTAMAAPDKGSTSSFIHIDSGGLLDIKISYYDDDRKFKIRGEGKFRFNDAETEMVEMSDDSYLDITETTDAYKRRVRFEGHGSNIEETYWLDSDEVSKDAVTRRWLAEIIPSMYRLTGIDARGRTKRIFEARGVDGVLDEIELIPGSYTKRNYMETLVELDELSDSETERFMGLAGAVSGSYDLRETLTAFVKHQTLSNSDWHAFARTAASIAGSYDLRETLSAAAKNFSGPVENWTVLLDTAGQVSGSYDLRETLTGFAGTMPKDDETITHLAKVTGKIDGSYDLRETLSAYAKTGGFGEAGWLALLDAAQEISSSYDLRSTLEEFADEMPRTAALVDRYREIAGQISGDHDREQAEEAL